MIDRLLFIIILTLSFLLWCSHDGHATVMKALPQPSCQLYEAVQKTTMTYYEVDCVPTVRLEIQGDTIFIRRK